MILYVYFKQYNGAYVAKDVFYTRGKFHLAKLNRLLTEVKEYINNPDNKHKIDQYSHFLPINVRVRDHKRANYEYSLIRRQSAKFPKSKIVNAIQKITDTTFNKETLSSKKEIYHKPRVLLWCALKYFSKLSAAHISYDFGFGEAAIRHSIVTSMPNYLYNRDPQMITWVEAVCDKLKDEKFFRTCVDGQYINYGYASIMQK